MAHAAENSKFQAMIAGQRCQETVRLKLRPYPYLYPSVKLVVGWTNADR